jgi:GNAT superfamily N-acetyltransferase
MQIALRPFDRSDADYATVLGVHNTAFPEYTEQVEDWRHWDHLRPEHCKAERWIAEHAGQAIGFGSYAQYPWSYHPHKFYLGVTVLPASRRQGVGGRIYEHLLARLASYEPEAVRLEGREDWSDSIAFARKRGFVDEMRAWESRLDLATFDAGPWAGHEAQVLAKGVTITTLRQLLDERGDAVKPELYEALTEMGRDVPRPDTYTPVPYEEWHKASFGDQNLLPEGYFVGLVGGSIAGGTAATRRCSTPA